MNDADLLTRFPPTNPTTRLLWTAIVDVGPRQDLGAGPAGQRFMVPILGGQFYAGPGCDSLQGQVLPGGADRQVLRPDGVKELDALYEMQASNGDVLTIRNRVIVDETREPERYAMSVISVSAPAGDLDWLNRRLILGSLQSARPERPAVIIRAWETDVVPQA
ncbi:DUF3237 domain-containing protein [Tropicibacter sp. R15_0]|uniref:DUF3237 domain-containing protein n=1 Tax=Tropicibacter sp. R15_0 TaxID=2821101 RepID=UPI001ADD606B|nr:DUF3237 domain-containing protein [Tropicibacter sp. R15_0]MBO9464223.1 DUF3237 domain-containing protein [Tropicibacter sp. R15_0]